MYNSSAQVISKIHEAIATFGDRFKDDDLLHSYDYSRNITSIENLNVTFGTNEWNHQAGHIIDEIWLGVENFIFEAFGIESEPHVSSTSIEDLNHHLWEVIETVNLYFYIASGVFLIVLAIMYIVGKKSKARGEIVSIVIRIIVGIGLIMPCLAYYYSVTKWSSYNFLVSAMMLPVVMLGYLFGKLLSPIPCAQNEN